MKKSLFTVIYLTVFLSNCYAQKHDNIWLLGWGGASQMPGFGVTVLDFSNDTMQISFNPEILISFDAANSAFSNKDGALLYYSNGIVVRDSSSQPMENGDDLNPFQASGLNLPQGVLALPFPNQNNLSCLIAAEKVWIDGWGPESAGLFYSIIDMSENDGLGEVILKRESLVIDTLSLGKIVATKHANGRDWWIVINESHTNRFYKILLDNNGIAVYDNQTIGMPNEEGLGQATFSPDGNTYVMFNSIDATVGQFIEIYDFDRCSGELSNHRRMHLTNNVSGGVAISPNSRYLYVSSYVNIFQYDLWADSIASTRDTVAVYDGFQSPFATRFFLAQLAPDGKIYINSPNSVNVLHVIHNPDEAGAACNVEQHGIQLLTENSFSMPNHPNYRLGALAGSACDSLPPIAAFTEEADIANVLLYQFQDESLQGVNSWHWDFGDGTSSEKVYPLHLFPGLGSYEICLTVSNGVEEDTYCKTISIELVSLEDLKTPDVLLYPNPTNKELTIEFQKAGFDELKIQTVLANVLLKQSLSGEPENLQLDVSHLSPGLYFCSFYKNGELVSSEKVMIIH